MSCYPALFAELLDRGWTRAECGKLASGNILRVMRESVDGADRAEAGQLNGDFGLGWRTPSR